MTNSRIEAQAKAPADTTAEGFGRRRFLAWSSTALLGAIAFGGKLPGLSIEQALAQTPAAQRWQRPLISAKVTSAS